MARRRKDMKIPRPTESNVATGGNSPKQSRPTQSIDVVTGMDMGPLVAFMRTIIADGSRIVGVVEGTSQGSAAFVVISER